MSSQGNADLKAACIVKLFPFSKPVLSWFLGLMTNIGMHGVTLQGNNFKTHFEVNIEAKAWVSQLVFAKYLI